MADPGDAGDYAGDTTLALYCELLRTDKSADVRRAIVASLPPCPAAAAAVLERVTDINEGVRRAAFSVDQRVRVLREGLADPAPAARSECAAMLESWCGHHCGGDVALLLARLAPAAGPQNEAVAELAARRFVEAGLLRPSPGATLRQQAEWAEEGGAGSRGGAERVEPEHALCFRVLTEALYAEAEASAAVSELLPDIGREDGGRGGRNGGDCRRRADMAMTGSSALRPAAVQDKGRRAAATGGGEAAMLAAEAATVNAALEAMLPATVTGHVRLVERHLATGGPEARFTARQLLYVAVPMDFADAAGRAAAAGLVRRLLLDGGSSDSPGSDDAPPDRPFLLADKQWRDAVDRFSRRVHGEGTEWAAAVVAPLGELRGLPPGADAPQGATDWCRALGAAEVLLSSATGPRQLATAGASPAALLDHLLLPAVRVTATSHHRQLVCRVASPAKPAVVTLAVVLLPQAGHGDAHVRTAGLRCLALLGHMDAGAAQLALPVLERVAADASAKPCERHTAVKALVDLTLCHGADGLDGKDGGGGGTAGLRLSALLVALLDEDQEREEGGEEGGHAGEEADGPDEERGGGAVEGIHGLAAEGLAKLLLCRPPPDAPPMPSETATPLARLLALYSGLDGDRKPRLRQCLYIFFENYAGAIAAVFLEVVLRSWPQLTDGSRVASAKRKQAAQLARLMVALLQRPLLAAQQAVDSAGDPMVAGDRGLPAAPAPVMEEDDTDRGHEALALQLAAEVVRGRPRPDRRALSALLMKCLSALTLRPSQREPIAVLLALAPRMAEEVAGDGAAIMELQDMVARLEQLSLDSSGAPAAPISNDDLQALLDGLCPCIPAYRRWQPARRAAVAHICWSLRFGSILLLSGLAAAPSSREGDGVEVEDGGTLEEFRQPQQSSEVQHRMSRSGPRAARCDEAPKARRQQPRRQSKAQALARLSTSSTGSAVEELSLAGDLEPQSTLEAVVNDSSEDQVAPEDSSDVGFAVGQRIQHARRHRAAAVNDMTDSERDIENVKNVQSRGQPPQLMMVAAKRCSTKGGGKTHIRPALMENLRLSEEQTNACHPPPGMSVTNLQLGSLALPLPPSALPVGCHGLLREADGLGADAALEDAAGRPDTEHKATFLHLRLELRVTSADIAALLLVLQDSLRPLPLERSGRCAQQPLLFLHLLLLLLLLLLLRRPCSALALFCVFVLVAFLGCVCPILVDDIAG
eukprot:SM000028S10061  [mRNA]  locus=s28:132958:139561:- [translate_table: standard]